MRNPRPVQPSSKNPSRLLRLALGLSFLTQAAYGVTIDLNSVGCTLGGTNTYGYSISGDGKVLVGEADFGAGSHSFKFSTLGGIVDIGTFGGTWSQASGVSYDGSVIVGISMYASGPLGSSAYKYTSATGMVSLGVIGGSTSSATAVSGDGKVVVGGSTYSSLSSDYHAFKYTDANGMDDIGGLPGGTYAIANDVSYDGSVIVGEDRVGGYGRAFRYTTAGGMVDIGTLGGTDCFAYGVSSNGLVIVGESKTLGGAVHAFKYTVSGGFTDLGTIEGSGASQASDASADGSVIVGNSDVPSLSAYHAFKYTDAGGMVDLGTLGGTNSEATSVSANGAIIAGNSQVAGDAAWHPFIYTNSAMVLVSDWMNSVTGANSISTISSTLANVPMEGAHHRPLMSYDSMGKDSQAWVTGDFGATSGNADSRVITGEAGASTILGNDCVGGIAFGYGSQKNDLANAGTSKVSGNYLLGEIDLQLPDRESILSLVVIYGQWDSSTNRGYTTGSGIDYSHGSNNINTTSARIRLDGPGMNMGTDVKVSPFISIAWTNTLADAYTETTGSFPASFDAQSHLTQEGRLGLIAAMPIGYAGSSLRFSVELVHRFDSDPITLTGTDISGSMPFSTTGAAPQANQVRLGMDIDHRFDKHTMVNFSLHYASEGESPDLSGAVSLRYAF
jgi:probable HAF family extracellular repeat protein